MAIDQTLRDKILDATEQVLKRHGNDKANVVDVADVLGMSSGNVYRFFSSKKALLEAVALRWMERWTEPLNAIVADESRPAGVRLRDWFDTLRRAKRRKLVEEPELYQMYAKIAEGAGTRVEEHVAVLLRQVGTIIGEGVEMGEFPVGTDVPAASRAFLHASSAFHHPAILLRQAKPPSEADANAVIEIILAGLRAGVLG